MTLSQARRSRRRRFRIKAAGPNDVGCWAPGLASRAELMSARCMNGINTDRFSFLDGRERIGAAAGLRGIRRRWSRLAAQQLLHPAVKAAGKLGCRAGRPAISAPKVTIAFRGVGARKVPPTADVHQCARSTASTVAIPAIKEPIIAIAARAPRGKSKLITDARKIAAAGRAMTK
jgi:hypothetical protein